LELGETHLREFKHRVRKAPVEKISLPPHTPNDLWYTSKLYDINPALLLHYSKDVPFI